jgi:hypothetical protein
MLVAIGLLTWILQVFASALLFGPEVELASFVGLAYALGYLYYRDIPSLHPIPLFGVRVTQKIATYVLLAQVRPSTCRLTTNV